VAYTDAWPSAWINQGTTTGTGSSLTSNAVWTYWCTTTSSSNATTMTINYPANQIWTTWCTAPTMSVTTANVTWTQWVETEEQKKERKAREAEWRAQEAERNRLWQEQETLRVKAAHEANERAEKLLLEHLADEERERYQRSGYFLIRGQSGKLYKIKKGTHGNVFLLDEETKKEKVSYCVQPSGVPVADANLAQALYLKHAEADFLKAANARQLN